MFSCQWRFHGAPPVARMAKRLPAMRETQVLSLGQEDPLEKAMATHSSTVLGQSHEWRSLIGYSPWGLRESDMTEWLHKDKEDFINTSFAKKTDSAFCYEYDPFPISHIGVSLVAQWLRIHLPMQEMWVRSLGGEDPLEEEITTHPSILAWKIPWTEEPGEPQSMGLQKNQTQLNNWAHRSY